ncbi:protein INVOLVED IN DE NOVO 2-like [Daucus carota subsp. sativus]|uniref:protein INVOLVED IN DE NOVO 2-like n=1 Tax=Daucus carota subsp. sativus TaxID=79200 RepID=UPI003082EE1D
MSSWPSAAEMGTNGELDVEKTIEAMEKSFENLECINKVNINSIKKLTDEYDILSQSYNEDFETLTYNATEEVKKLSENKYTEESIRKLAEDRKKHEENLERRISEIRKELDAAEQESSKLHKQALDSIKQIKESQVIEALSKIKDLGEDCYYLKDLNETLKLKEGKSMEALNKAHKAILEDAIVDPHSRRSFNRYIGELYSAPFMDAMRKIYNCGKKEAFYLARPIYQVWEKYLQDPDWRPLKVVHVDGQPKEIIDEDDPKLKNLKIEYGESVHEAVTEALTERMQYNPVERRGVELLWDHEQNRPATVGEAVAHLVQLLQDYWEE